MATAPWGRCPAGHAATLGERRAQAALGSPGQTSILCGLRHQGSDASVSLSKSTPRNGTQVPLAQHYHAVDYVSTCTVHLRPCNRMSQIKKTVPEKKAWEYLISTKILRKSSCLRHESEPIGCSFIWNKAIIQPFLLVELTEPEKSPSLSLPR